jgi:hypothetical protein
VTEAELAGLNAVFDTPTGFVERAVDVDNVITI